MFNSKPYSVDDKTIDSDLQGIYLIFRYKCIHPSFMLTMKKVEGKQNKRSDRNLGLQFSEN